MSENEHRVKYFPLPDLACGWGIEKIEELYQKKENLEVRDINDAIEFYNFYLYSRGLRLLNCQVRSRLKV